MPKKVVTWITKIEIEEKRNWFHFEVSCSQESIHLNRSKRKEKEAATGDVLWEKVFLEISQNSQENTCVGVSFLIKLQASAGRLLLKKRNTCPNFELLLHYTNILF